MDKITTERTCSFELQATSIWVINVLGLLFGHVIHGRLYNQALADVPSSAIESILCTARIRA